MLEDVINLTTERSVCTSMYVCVCLALWQKLQNRLYSTWLNAPPPVFQGPVFSSFIIHIKWFPCSTFKEQKGLSSFCPLPTQFRFNDAEAHNCFKMLEWFLAILTSLTTKIQRVLMSNEGFREWNWRTVLKIRDRPHKMIKNRRSGDVKCKRYKHTQLILLKYRVLPEMKNQTFTWRSTPLQ